jgi:ribosomal protein S18 acetylase RimI-like enzyme
VGPRDTRTLEFRPYAAGDREAVLDLCQLAFAPACELLERRLGADLGWRTFITRYARSLTRSDAGKPLLVAALGGTVVAFVQYRIDRRSQSGSIALTAVHPDYQGTGIGSQMVDHVVDAMSAQGLQYVTAETGGDECHAAARRAYERVGFVAVPMVHYFMKLDSPRPGSSRRDEVRGGGKRGKPVAASRRAGGRRGKPRRR